MQVSGEVQMQPQSRGIDPIAMTMATVGMGVSLYSARQMTEKEYLKHLIAWVENCSAGAALTAVDGVGGCACRRRSVMGDTEGPFNVFVLLFERKSAKSQLLNQSECSVRAGGFVT